MPHPFSSVLPGTAPRRSAAGDPTRRPSGLAAREGAGDAKPMDGMGRGRRPRRLDPLAARHGERALRVARRIARAPLPAPPGPAWRRPAWLRPAAPAATGALAAALGHGLRPAFAAPPQAEDPSSPLAGLPLAAEAP